MEARTLWMGGVQPEWDEAYLRGLLEPVGGKIERVSIIQDRRGGFGTHIAFVEFGSHESAQHVLTTLNGQPIGTTGHVFRLNWGRGGPRVPGAGPSGFGGGVGGGAVGAGGGGGGGGGGGSGGPPAGMFPPGVLPPGGMVPGADGSYSLFVGDLAFHVTDPDLRAFFRTFFSTVTDAHVAMDRVLRRSRGFGFVRFSDKTEAERALTELNGHMLEGRPLRMSVATPKGPSPRRVGPGPMGMGPSGPMMGMGGFYGGSMPYGGGGPMGFAPTGFGSPYMTQIPDAPPADPSEGNTTIFVGGLNDAVTEFDLKQLFNQIGPVSGVRLLRGKGCGFVDFQFRAHAEAAIGRFNGYRFLHNGATIRLDWGKAHTGPGPAMMMGGPLGGAGGPGGRGGVPVPTGSAMSLFGAPPVFPPGAGMYGVYYGSPAAMFSAPYGAMPGGMVPMAVGGGDPSAATMGAGGVPPMDFSRPDGGVPLAHEGAAEAVVSAEGKTA